ncbi:MAG: Tryptophan--tRNA ligase [Chlamydiae bacterium]|nr:Tryptophan--tRNA ligase [Chlamydiota bacterium]
MLKKKILTGDRPTGKLHLGHYLGTIQNRVALQDKYDCSILIADLHVLTTKPQKEHILASRNHIKDMVVDYLACGIDPEKSVIYLQSAIPAVCEMSLYFQMLVSLNRLTGLPSLKEMARSAHIDEESIPLGLVAYPVLQTADILMSKADLVPVGKDNEAHVELARLIARRFNQYYGEFFNIPEVVVGQCPTLVGTDGLNKMSKSLNNTIFLSDSAADVAKKVKKMYTDPNRVHAHIPGEVEKNPVFIYHRWFNSNQEEVNDLKERYQKGSVTDVEVKDKLTVALNNFLDPIREKRNQVLSRKGYVEEVIYEGTLKMSEIAQENIKQMRSVMGISGTWNKISRVARAKS